jgi:hypothetical protein
MEVAVLLNQWPNKAFKTELRANALRPFKVNVIFRKLYKSEWNMNRYIRVIYVAIIIFISPTTVFAEGPFTTEGSPKLRVDAAGELQIFTMPENANCYSNKAQMSASEPGRDLIASLVLAAQMAGRGVNIWIERYDSTNPQRCKITHIEIES